MNIADLLRQRGVEYVEHGPNVRKGHVAIKCPFCGDADPSQHLNINPTTGSWSCFRDHEHRGRRLHALLMKLLHCSYEAASSVLAETHDLSELAERVRRQPVVEPFETEAVLNPNDYHLGHLQNGHSLHGHFQSYLDRRGFPREQHNQMSSLYGLRVALTGPFKQRIVFTVHDNASAIVGFTGRCVDDGHLRYLSEPGLTVKRHLLWEPLLAIGGRVLFVCEGPFDALKMDWYLRQAGKPDRATCLFGVNPTALQLDRLIDLADRFKHVAILFDRAAMAQAMRLQRVLATIRPRLALLPGEVNDPGDLTPEQVLGISEKWF